MAPYRNFQVDPLRLCIIHQCGKMTGIDRLTDELIRALALCQDVKLTVVVNQKRGDFPPNIEQWVVPSQNFAVPGFRALWMGKLYWKLQGRKFDVVYGIHYSIWSLFDLKALWGKTHRVFMICDVMWQRREVKWKLHWLVYRMVFFPMMVRCADSFATLSSAAREEIHNIFGIKRDTLFVHRQGVTHKSSVTDLSRFKLPDKPILFNAGALKPNKNIVNIIEAYALVRKAGHSCSLVFSASSGTGTPYGQSVIDAVNRLSKEYQADVYFLGGVSEEELWSLYNRAFCFLMPSVEEGYGLPILEAMSCGLPVVTSCLSSMPEVSGNAAVLVDPADPCSIADGVNRLFAEVPLHAKLRRDGLDHSRSMTWEKSAHELLRHFQSIVSGVFCK